MEKFFVGTLQRPVMRDSKYFVEEVFGIIILGLAIPLRIINRGSEVSGEFIKKNYPDF